MLFEPDIDDVYMNLLEKYNAIDYRIEFPLNKELRKKIDEGWKLFKEYFYEFINAYNIKYEDFDNGYIVENKNRRKIYRVIREFYLEDENLAQSLLISLDGFTMSILKRSREEGRIPEELYQEEFSTLYNNALKEMFEKIGIVKLPKRNLKVVLSLNFIDWFLCASGEKWSSCLNLNSTHEGAFWYGLPGTIVDKNRAMLYITDGSQKEFHGITAEKIISRSWIVLTDQNELQIIKFYPQKFSNDLSLLHNIFPDDINYLLEDPEVHYFTSKYPIEPIRNKEGEGIFIYQDKTGFNIDKYITNKAERQNGIFIFNENDEIVEDTKLIYTEGLSGLIESNTEILDYCNEDIYSCAHCGYRTNDGDVIDGDFYCVDCVNDLFFTCDECGEFLPTEEAHRHGPFVYCDYCEGALEDCE